MGYDLNTDRQWKRLPIAGHGDATVEARCLLPADFRVIDDVPFMMSMKNEDLEAELTRIIGDNLRNIEGLSLDGAPITEPRAAYENGGRRLQQALVVALQRASTLTADDLGKS